MFNIFQKFLLNYRIGSSSEHRNCLNPELMSIFALCHCVLHRGQSSAYLYYTNV